MSDNHIPNIHATVHAVEEAIDLLCSAYQIAGRGGKDTNWKAFQASLQTCLAHFNRSGVTARTYRIPGNDADAPSSN